MCKREQGSYSCTYNFPPEHTHHKPQHRQLPCPASSPARQVTFRADTLPGLLHSLENIIYNAKHWIPAPAPALQGPRMHIDFSSRIRTESLVLGLPQHRDTPCSNPGDKSAANHLQKSQHHPPTHRQTAPRGRGGAICGTPHLTTSHPSTRWGLTQDPTAQLACSFLPSLHRTHHPSQVRLPGWHTPEAI